LKIEKDGLLVSTSGYYYDWATARANLKVKKGVWYYEVTLTNRTSCRIGWVTDQYEPSTDTGIGNDQNSWGVSQDRKYHNSKDGDKFGSSWSSGDIIGCLLDMDLQRMSFFRNGNELGVAFYNLSAKDWLRPAISLSYDSKITLNFGPTFKNKPVACAPPFPILTTKEKKSVEEVFAKYAEGQEFIAGASIQPLAIEFGATGPEHPILSCIAWKLRPEDQWVFRKQEWLSMWAREQAYTLTEMKKAAKDWVQSIQQDRPFREFYAWIFDYFLQPGASAIPAELSIQAWRITGLNSRWAWFDKYAEFLQQGKKTVDKDTWKQTLRLVDSVGTDVSKFDTLDFWPPIIDDFMAQMLRKSH